MLHSGTMPSLFSSILEQVHLNTIVDIGITALLIYWLFKLIRGTRAVRLVIGVSVLVLVYGLAVAFNLLLLTQILQAGAVVGLFALVVIFQPELRRALERIGRVGSFGWLLSPAESRIAVHVSTEVARAAAELSAEGQGALIVLQRETGLEEVAETGVMIHGDVSADLLRTIFTPKSPLHDGAVIIRDDRIVAAGTLLPLAETIDPDRALRDASPCRPRDHRADRRDRRRRVRGERPDQPGRARPDRSQPDRGRARPRHPGTARPGRRQGRSVRLAAREPATERRRAIAPTSGTGSLRGAAAATPRAPGDRGRRARTADDDRDGHPGPADGRTVRGRLPAATDPDRSHAASGSSADQGPGFEQDPDPVADHE